MIRLEAKQEKARYEGRTKERKGGRRVERTEKEEKRRKERKKERKKRQNPKFDFQHFRPEARAEETEKKC